MRLGNQGSRGLFGVYLVGEGEGSGNCEMVKFGIVRAGRWNGFIELVFVW